MAEVVDLLTETLKEPPEGSGPVRRSYLAKHDER